MRFNLRPKPLQRAPDPRAYWIHFLLSSTSTYDLPDMDAFKIFMDIDPASQIERLQKRSLDHFDDFVQKWIPMETKYFETFSIKEKSDYVFSR